RLKRCQDGSLDSLDGVGGLPLGVRAGAHYAETQRQLQHGDQIIFYTDGITETHNRHDELFGMERLDQALKNCRQEAQALLDTVLAAVETFADGRPAADDRTLIVARVS
ncbi:MAG: serine/threonine-protein phosphatase, partial [Planctomycetia bacterium]|nr:serine/threonine-protein phosphatase [Planctomycetia bacterium]